MDGETAREHLKVLLQSLDSVDDPAKASAMFAHASPEQKYMDAAVAGDEGVEIHYSDATLSVLVRPGESSDRLWIAGTDPFHQTGVIGIPIDVPPAERPVAWTRADVLALLELDAWQPVSGETAALVGHDVCRRLQGRVAVQRFPRDRAVRAVRTGDFRYVDPEDVFVQEGESKLLLIGDQKVTIESAGVLNAVEATPHERLRDKHRPTMLAIPEGTLLSVTGPVHDRRQLAAAGGVYEFTWLGSSLTPFPDNRERARA